MNLKKTTILIVGGGHLTPAIATIQALQKNRQLNLVFVGRNTTDVYLSKSKEQQEVEQLGVEFVAINPAKFHRKPISKNIKEIPKLLTSLEQARKILKKHQPDLVLTFGGYVSLPVAVLARLLTIPVVIHEQTTVLGRANQFIARFAVSLATSWPTITQFPAKSTLVGNPVRKEFLSRQTRPNWFKPSKKPLIYVTGGNQGSKAINEFVIENLESLVDLYTLVHQTGDSRNSQDYNHGYSKRSTLLSTKQQSYILRKWLSAKEVSWFHQHADVVICRSGANTLSEILVTKTRAVCIPLPVSGQNEQQKNASFVSKMGLVTMLDQTNLDQLPQLIKQTLNSSIHLDPLGVKMQQLHSKAADRLASLVITCVEESRES